MENLYCTIFIVDISQNPDESETVSSRIQQLIEDHGGIIKKIDRWGKKRLAFSIQKKTHGFYVEVEFTANSRLNIPKILEGEYRLNDRVLRHLTYIVDKKELIQREKSAGKIQQKKEEEKVKVKVESEVSEGSVKTALPPVEDFSEEMEAKSTQPETDETPAEEKTLPEKDAEQTTEELTTAVEEPAISETKDQAEELPETVQEAEESQADKPEQDDKTDIEEKSDDKKIEAEAEEKDDQVKDTEESKQQQPEAVDAKTEVNDSTEDSSAEEDSKKNES